MWLALMPYSSVDFNLFSPRTSTVSSSVVYTGLVL